VTQAVQAEIFTGSPQVGSVPTSAQAAVPVAEGEVSWFAQLLAMLQAPAGVDMPVPAEVHPDAPPESEKAPKPLEMTQVAVLLAPPVFWGNVPAPAQPPDESVAADSAVHVIQRETANGMPISVPPPATGEAAPARERTAAAMPSPTNVESKPEQPSAFEGMAFQPPADRAGDTPSAEVSLPVDKAMPRVRDAISPPALETSPAPHPTSRAAETRAGDATSVRPPTDDLLNVSGVQNPAAPATPSGNAGASQGDGREEHREPALTVRVGTRSRIKPAERPFSMHVNEMHPHGHQTGEATAAVSRVAENAPPQPEVSPVEVVRQVARQIETLTSQRGTSSVTLQLEPEHLGRLRVTISLNDGAIHTHIVADNHVVRQMLESNSSLLQQALQQRGLQLGALQVSVQGDGRQFLLHQPYTPPPRGGWLESDAAIRAANEASFVRATPGGINLLA